MRNFVAPLIVAATIAAGAGAPATNARAQTTIKFGTFIPPTSITFRAGAKPWMEAVERESDGRIKFQTFLGGSLSRSPAKQYELLVNGIQDATIVLPSYTQKLFPDFSILSLPYLVESAEEASVAGWRLHEAGMLSGLDKVQVVSIWTNTNSAIHVNRTIRSVEDLKGLRIRASGPEEADIIKTLGASPVGMSITQVAESLNRGVIDGALAGWTALRAFRIFPLIKAHYEEPYGIRGFFLGLRKDVFEGMSERDRAIIMKHGGETFARAMGKANDDEEADIRREAEASPDHVLLEPSPEDRASRARTFQRFHDEWAKTHENGAKKYETLKKIIEDIRKGA